MALTALTQVKPPLIDMAAAFQQLSQSTGAGLVGFRLTSSASIQTVEAVLRESVLAIAFGVLANGTADDAAALQLACTYAASKGGGEVQLPRGTIRIASPVTVPQNVILRGYGREATKVLCAGGVDTLTFTGDYSGLILASLTSTAPRAAGIAVNLKNATRGNIFTDLRIQNQFMGMQISGEAVGTCIERVEILDPTPGTGTGMLINGGNDTFMRAMIMDASGNQPFAGLRIKNTQAIWMTDCDILHCGTNLLIDPGTGDRITWLFFNCVALDQATNAGLQVNVTGTGTVRGLFFNGCWSATNGMGVYLNKASGATLDTVTFQACEVVNNARQGYLCISCDNLVIDGGVVSGNGTQQSGTYAGIDIGNGNTGFSIKGVRSGFLAKFQNSQSWGILIGTNCDEYQVTGNNVLKNAVGGIADNSISTSVTRQVSENLGAKTIARGTVTVPAGATSVTFTPSLMGNASWGQLTPLNSNLGNTPFWLGALGSSQQSANLGAALDRAITFVYQVGCYL